MVRIEASMRLDRCSQDDVPGKTPVDHTTLRSLSALIASLPASESQEFRQEFDTVRAVFGTSHNISDFPIGVRRRTTNGLPIDSHEVGQYTQRGQSLTVLLTFLYLLK